jgi:hypothetical protein
MLRLEPLLYKKYENNQLQITDNIDCYNRAMADIAKMFDLLKTKRNMFSKYNSFEEFKAEGLTAIENKKRKSLGLDPINANTSNVKSDNQQETQKAQTVQFTQNYAGSAKPPHIDNAEVKVDSVQPQTSSMQQSSSKQVGFTYKTIDVSSEKTGEVSGSKHYENVKYQFVCETLNNLFGNKTTGLCAIEVKDPKNIEIINRARRVWQAMAYDNGMRIVAPNGKEIALRDMLRNYYEQKDGYDQNAIPERILGSSTIPSEIKSLFEDLYVSKGLYGMAEIIENDVGLAVGRAPKDVISQAVNTYVQNMPDKNMTIKEYDEQCKMGDIQYETAKYLQQNYDLLGGCTTNTQEQAESAKNSQDYLKKYLSNSLEMAKNRQEKLFENDGYSI